MSLIIVVGTARCGSTMLSRMMAKHPEVLSLNEYWNCFMDSEGYIPIEDISGTEFWQRLTTPASSYDGLIRAGIKRDEPVDPDRTRFDYHQGVPPLLRVLSHLSAASPDLLYDEIEPVVTAWPLRSVADHSRALFENLAARFGRGVVMERTGGSVGYLEQLYEMFPEARFVFLHRHGPDAALSMSRYSTLQLAAMRRIAEAVTIGESAGLEMFPPEIRMASPEDFKGLIEPPFDGERFMAFPIPLGMYGWIWSDLTRRGTRAIRQVPDDRWMPLRYEPLLSETRTELTKLAGFMGVSTDPQWLDWASEFVDTGRAGSATAQLHPGDLAALRAVCAAGVRAFEVLESEHSAAVSA